MVLRTRLLFLKNTTLKWDEPGCKRLSVFVNTARKFEFHKVGQPSGSLLHLWQSFLVEKFGDILRSIAKLGKNVTLANSVILARVCVGRNILCMGIYFFL